MSIENHEYFERIIKNAMVKSFYMSVTLKEEAGRAQKFSSFSGICGKQRLKIKYNSFMVRNFPSVRG